MYDEKETVGIERFKYLTFEISFACAGYWIHAVRILFRHDLPIASAPYSDGKILWPHLIVLVLSSFDFHHLHGQIAY